MHADSASVMVPPQVLSASVFIRRPAAALNFHFEDRPFRNVAAQKTLRFEAVTVQKERMSDSVVFNALAMKQF